MSESCLHCNETKRTGYCLNNFQIGLNYVPVFVHPFNYIMIFATRYVMEHMLDSVHGFTVNLVTEIGVKYHLVLFIEFDK